MTRVRLRRLVLVIAVLGLLGAQGCSDDATSEETQQDTSSADTGEAQDASGEDTEEAQDTSGVDVDEADTDEADTDEADATEADADVPVEDTRDVDEPDAVIPPLDERFENMVALVEPTAQTLTTGHSPEITFTVPEGAVSVTVVAIGEGQNTYVVGSWMGPDGVAQVPEGWTSDQNAGGPSLCFTCLLRVSASTGAHAALLPNNQRAYVEPGEHTITVYGATGSPLTGLRPVSGDVEVAVYAKVLEEEPVDGVIDFNMHFTGAGGWTAATAPEDPAFQQMMGEVRDIYAQVGVTIGDVTYRDIDPGLRVIENVLLDPSELQALYGTSAGNALNAVNIFFVEELASLSAGGGGFGLILGIAGGIPGPTLVQGTPRSGVAIAVESHQDPSLPFEAALSKTLAHEVGHFLGLFHTSEADLGFGQQLHDPLDDTPENDAGYLMFNSGEGDALSPWQGRVMRYNPWVRQGVEAP